MEVRNARNLAGILTSCPYDKAVLYVSLAIKPRYVVGLHDNLHSICELPAPCKVGMQGTRKVLKMGLYHAIGFTDDFHESWA